MCCNRLRDLSAVEPEIISLWSWCLWRNNIVLSPYALSVAVRSAEIRNKVQIRPAQFGPVEFVSTKPGRLQFYTGEWTGERWLSLKRVHIQVLRPKLDLQLWSGKLPCHNHDRGVAKRENEDEVARNHVTTENTIPELPLSPGLLLLLLWLLLLLLVKVVSWPKNFTMKILGGNWSVASKQCWYVQPAGDPGLLM